MQKQLIFALVFLLLSACTTPGEKLKESGQANALARKNGFAKTPLEAVKKAGQHCNPKDEMKWDLKFTKQGPYIQQDVDLNNHAYGAYQVICFSFSVAGSKKIQIETAHVGGGFSKAYYVLPMYSVYDKDFKVLAVQKNLEFKQIATSGNFATEFKQNFQADQIYYHLIESNNRYPELSWNEYENSGLGGALRGAFPIEVRSSPFGSVKVEISR